MTKFCFWLFFLSFLAMGEETPPQAPTSESFGQTAWRDFASPVTTDAKYILLMGSALTAGLVFFRQETINQTQKGIVAGKPLGKYSYIGDILGQLVPNFIYFAGMLGHGSFTNNATSYDRAALMFKSTLYTGLVTTMLKYTVREKRPDNSNVITSFPSGHTATAFNFASVVQVEHGWFYGVPAYLMATFVGFSRINDNRHYLHDVVAGATIGISYSLGIYYRTLQRKGQTKDAEIEAQENSVFQVLPSEKMDGMTLSWQKSF